MGVAGTVAGWWHRMARGRAGTVVLWVDAVTIAVAVPTLALLWLAHAAPGIERSVVERTDAVRGRAAETLYDTEAAGPLSGDAMRASVTLRHALAEKPAYVEGDGVGFADLVVHDVLVDAEVSAALSRYQGLTAARTVSLATATAGDAPRARRDWQAMHRLRDMDAHDGGGLNEIYPDWYVAHRDSVPGRAIYDLEVGDELTIDGERLVVVGEDYGHVGEPSAWVRGRNPDAVLLQTCLDTGGIAGDPLIYRVCRRVGEDAAGVVTYR